tara:strand:+ start:11252 stop:11752 length:501 start_codon:yes stop_codon:yes gene_type:complete
MKLKLILILLSFFLISCGSSKKTTKKQSRTTKTSKKRTSSKADAIIAYAKGYSGTKYKYGGTTKRGIDCSGLLYVAFQSEQISLPRVSRDMAQKGAKIPLTKVQKGDLLFFNTSKKRRTINHVGLVVEKNKKGLFFIHSTTSSGVIISSFDEVYWKKAFIEARKII